MSKNKGDSSSSSSDDDSVSSTDSSSTTTSSENSKDVDVERSNTAQLQQQEMKLPIAKQFPVSLFDVMH